MAYTSTLHEDRMRGRKTFKWSLVVGILAGGMFGASIELGISYYNQGIPIFDQRLVLVYIMFIGSIILVLYALRSSEIIETWTLECEFRQPKSTLLNLINGALDEAEEFPNLKSILSSYHSTVSSDTGFTQQRIETARKFASSVRRFRAGRNDISGPIVQHIEAIESYPTRLQNLEDELCTRMKDSAVFKERGWKTHWTGKGADRKLVVKKPRKNLTGRQIMRIALVNNLTDSLHRPFVCYAAVSSTISLQDAFRARHALDRLFGDILSGDKIIEFWLFDYMPLEQALIEKMKTQITKPVLTGLARDVKDPLIKEMKNKVKKPILGRIDELEKSLADSAATGQA